MHCGVMNDFCVIDTLIFAMQMEVIGIDEAQFFDDLLDFCQGAADLDNKTIIVAGLDGDFLRYSILESAITGRKSV